MTPFLMNKNKILISLYVEKSIVIKKGKKKIERKRMKTIVLYRDYENFKVKQRMN